MAASSFEGWSGCINAGLTRPFPPPPEPLFPSSPPPPDFLEPLAAVSFLAIGFPSLRYLPPRSRRDTVQTLRPPATRAAFGVGQNGDRRNWFCTTVAGTSQEW